MRRIKSNIMASFYFAFGFTSQIIGMLLGGIANICLRSAMREAAKIETEGTAKCVAKCRDEVIKWENEQGRQL